MTTSSGSAPSGQFRRLLNLVFLLYLVALAVLAFAGADLGWFMAAGVVLLVVLGVACAFAPPGFIAAQKAWTPTKRDVVRFGILLVGVMTAALVLGYLGAAFRG